MLVQLGVVFVLVACCHGDVTSQKWLRVLPWETRDVLLNLKEHLDVQQLTGQPVPIYRPDQGETIAYWLIRYNNNHYTIISAGDHTGDRRVLLQGEGESPVDIVQQKAESLNSTCVRYMLLTPSPDLNMGCYTAGTLLSERPIGDTNVTSLWRNENKEPDESEDDSLVSDHQNIPDDLRNIHYYVIMPSQPAAFPFSHMREARIRPLSHNGSEVSAEAVCKLLGVCDETGRVHSYRKTAYGEVYVHLEPVNRGATSVEHDLHFVVEGTDHENRMVKKGFVLEPAHRWKRQTTSYTYYSIDEENLMPDYNQFKYGKCQVGCGPVAWAQIFGYYDRRGHRGSGSSSSQALYRCGSDGTTGSNSCQAPSSLDSRMRGYIGKLNDILRTFCLSGQGATYQNRMDDVESFFKARQGSSGDITLNTGSFFLTRLVGVYRDKYRDAALSYIRQKWPVIVGFRVSGVFSQHYAVMTKYRTRQVYKKTCFICKKKWVREYDMYLHMGWGGSSNGWREAKMFMAVVAKY